MPEGVGIASGKVILLGEHAVVYGVPALVAGLDRGARAVSSPRETDRIEFNGEVVVTSHELYRGLAAVRDSLGIGPVELRLTLDIPAGSGLGASAALGVATARSLGELVVAEGGERPRARRIEHAADEWERVFHGNASGVDRAAAASGGILHFVRGDEPTTIVPKVPLHLALAVAGPPASTREMVEGVARLRERNPSQFARNLAAIHSLVQNAEGCLRAGDAEGLGKLMDLCQIILAGWMLSTEGIEVACRVGREAGALGAKLTGSGGGGAVVFLAGSRASAEAITCALERENFPAFSCTIGRST